jgi:hypothetical protein
MRDCNRDVYPTARNARVTLEHRYGIARVLPRGTSLQRATPTMPGVRKAADLRRGSPCPETHPSESTHAHQRLLP